MGLDLFKGVWGRSILIGIERIDVFDVVSKVVFIFVVWFSNIGMVWFYWS